MTLTAIQSFKGAKNKHPVTLCVCHCGKERRVRTTRLKLGLVTECASCARASGASRGAASRRLPVDIAHNRKVMGFYIGGAKRRGFIFDLSESEFSTLIRSSCYYCGLAPSPINGVDRIDNSEGYTESNSVSCCSICNYAKRDMSASSFLAWVDCIHEHQSFLQRD